MKSLFQQARFILGAHKLSQAPPDQGIEIAFAGRSNAGKSRAINVITGLGTLARVSKTPGRTQQINFFGLLDDTRRVVDLPGYGYAKVPEKMRRHWVHTLGQYLLTRNSLHGLMLVMDVRHPLMPGDQQMLDWCHTAQMPVRILLTKADKLSRGQACATLEGVRKALVQYYPPADAVPAHTVPCLPGFTVQLFSALARTGADDARQAISDWLELTSQQSASDTDSQDKKKPRA